MRRYIRLAEWHEWRRCGHTFDDLLHTRQNIRLPTARLYRPLDSTHRQQTPTSFTSSSSSSSPSEWGHFSNQIIIISYWRELLLAVHALFCYFINDLCICFQFTFSVGFEMIFSVNSWNEVRLGVFQPKIASTRLFGIGESISLRCNEKIERTSCDSAIVLNESARV